jgi:hypothetical protein
MPTELVVLSQRAIARLVLVQSILTGLQVVAAASVLGDVVGSRIAALFIVCVAGAQQGVNTYLSKSTAESAVHIEAALSRVDDAVSSAETATTNADAATTNARGAMAAFRTTGR